MNSPTVGRVRRRKPRHATWRFILLDLDRTWLERLGPRHTAMCTDPEDIVEAIGRASRQSLWISSSAEMTEKLVGAFNAPLPPSRPHATLGDLLMLEPPRARLIPSLHGRFGRIVGEVRGFKWLPAEQLAEVLSAPAQKRRDLLIGGVADEQSGTLALVRGDLETITVPLSLFQRSGKTAPNFREFFLNYHGQTVGFGTYEATTDAVLYEVDSEYRRRVNARRRAQEQGFGPSLRRLRKQRGLSRGDFPGLSAKTIARIERSEVAKPHGRTLTVIAGRLGVDPGEIETY